MWRKVIVVLLMAEISLFAQDRDGVAEIMSFLGAEAPEEIDEEEMERLSNFLQRPLKINQVTLERLVDSGLMDRYRAVSLSDYRARHGDVVSPVELSLVDGFGESFVKMLRPFISFESALLPGEKIRNKTFLNADIHIKGGTKYSDACQWMSGVKSKLEYGEKCVASIAMTSPYGQFNPDALNYSASVLMRFPRIHSKLVAGDFNARFGQGLVLWNGLSLSSLSSPSAFMKNPVGLSLSSSYTGNYSFTGAGFESAFGRYVISGIIAIPGIKYNKGRNITLAPALNVARYGKYGHVALTHSTMICAGQESMRHMSSFDTRWCFSGVDLFGECAFDWINGKIAAVGGAIVPAVESVRIATVLRYYPTAFESEYSAAIYSVSSATNEYSMSVSSEFDIIKKHRVVFTLDAAHLPLAKKGDRGGSMQFKGLLIWEGKVLDWLSLKARLTGRYRTWGEMLRTDARLDVLSEVGAFRVNLRLNALACSEVGLLSYLEGGYVRNRISVWVRQGLFKIDDWDDRIYVYERGAPGSFKVPAYYGRGLWSALMFSAKFSKLCKLYLRSSYTAYPFMTSEKRKPGKAELELYSVLSF